MQKHSTISLLIFLKWQNTLDSDGTCFVYIIVKFPVVKNSMNFYPFKLLKCALFQSRIKMIHRFLEVVQNRSKRYYCPGSHIVEGKFIIIFFIIA